MSSLNNQLNSFKRSFQASADIHVKRAGQAAAQAEKIKTATGTIANNTKASFETGSESKKRKKTTTIYSQPANTGTGHHAMSQLYVVIQYLKDSDYPQSVGSIDKGTHVDIRQNRDLWDKLIANDKIEYDKNNDTFAYKPTYQIRSKEDLLSLLIRMKTDGGMDYKDLKDSYSKLSNAVEELAAEGQILVVRNKDGNPRVLFYNNPEYNTTIDPEFKSMWSEIAIPDETDLPKALEEAGLKTMDVFEKKVSSDSKPKKSKTRNKRIKITNTHLSHIDLSKDYVPQNKK